VFEQRRRWQSDGANYEQVAVILSHTRLAISYIYINKKNDLFILLSGVKDYLNGVGAILLQKEHPSLFEKYIFQ
jgi:hypothetical protein